MLGELLAKLAQGERLDEKETEQLRLQGNQLELQTAFVNGLSNGQSVAENFQVRDVTFFSSPLRAFSITIKQTQLTDIPNETLTWVHFDTILHPSDQFYLDPDNDTRIHVVNNVPHLFVCGDINWYVDPGAGRRQAMLYNTYLDGSTHIQWLHEFASPYVAAGSLVLPFAQVAATYVGDAPLDYIGIQVLQGSGGALGLFGGTLSCFMC